MRVHSQHIRLSVNAPPERRLRCCGSHATLCSCFADAWCVCDVRGHVAGFVLETERDADMKLDHALQHARTSQFTLEVRGSGGDENNGDGLGPFSSRAAGASSRDASPLKVTPPACTGSRVHTTHLESRDLTICTPHRCGIHTMCRITGWKGQVRRTNGPQQKKHLASLRGACGTIKRTKCVSPTSTSLQAPFPLITPSRLPLCAASSKQRSSLSVAHTAYGATQTRRKRQKNSRREVQVEEDI